MDHLPPRFAPSAYKILRSVRLKPHCMSTPFRRAHGTLIPAAVMDINLILIRVNGTPSPCEQRRAFLCRGFDITACCTSLLVDVDGTYEVEGCEGAIEALTRGRLALRETSFRGGVWGVAPQMERILKYLLRGLRW